MKDKLKENVLVNKKVLFDLLNSHSCLAQNEYDKNKSYNTHHFSYLAEENFTKYMGDSGQ
jgi:hypothetical protein